MSNYQDEESLLRDIFLHPYLLPWEQKYLHKKIQDLDRAATYAAEYSSSGLYDFQQECTEWLRSRRECKGYSLVEMDTGCGKTRAIGEFLKNTPHGEVSLYLTPSGLVRQTWSELRKSGNESCERAETSSEFNKILSKTPRVIVANSAIPHAWASSLPTAWCVVLDEAHRFSHNFMLKFSVLDSYKLILCTATPYGYTCAAKLSYEAKPSQHFVVLKNPNLSRTLCMSDIAMKSKIVESLSQDIIENFYMTILAESGSFYILLAIWVSERREKQSRDSPEIKILEEILGRLLGTILNTGTRRVLEIAKRLTHPALRAELLLELPRVQEDDNLRSQVNSLPVPMKPSKNSRPVCACCGLQEEEIQSLVILQKRYLHYTEPPSPSDLLPRTNIFVRALFRFPSASTALNYYSFIQKHSEENIASFCVTSNLNASQRANRVKNFCQPQYSRVAVEIIKRSPKSLGTLPMVIWRYILDFVSDRSILIFDPRCGDVGYNLQCATHVISHSVPKSSEEALQLCGRVSRISSSNTPKQILEFLCLPRRFTGEILLYRHVKHGLEAKIHSPS